MAKKSKKLSRIHWLIERSDKVVVNSPLYNDDDEIEPCGWDDGSEAACGSMASVIVLFLLNNPNKEKEILGETYQEYLDLLSS